MSRPWTVQGITKLPIDCCRVFALDYSNWRSKKQNRLLPAGRCSVQRCWASCRWPTRGSRLPGWSWPSPRHSSSLGPWWRQSPPGPCPFYTRTWPESSSTGQCQSSAALWCSLRWWSCRNSEEPARESVKGTRHGVTVSLWFNTWNECFIYKINMILTPVWRMTRDVLEPSVDRIPAISTAM